MKTIKSYTDIEQSRKLAEILPLESADMYYIAKPDSTNSNMIPSDICIPRNTYLDGQADGAFCAWSLAALLKVLDFPALTQNKEDEWEVCVFDHDIHGYIEKTASNPVDTCVAMIEKLHKLKML